MRDRGTGSDQRGLTLVGILLMVVAFGVFLVFVTPMGDLVRESGSVSVAKSELQRASRAVEDFVTRRLRWPTSVEELEVMGYTPSPRVVFCGFERVPGTEERDPYVWMEVIHRDGGTAVSARSPIARGGFQERPRDVSTCADVDLGEERQGTEETEESRR